MLGDPGDRPQAVGDEAQDRPDEEPDNPDARYLAQRNHRAAEDRRALSTNLVRELKGADRAMAPEPVPQDQPDTPGERELSTFPAREGHIQLRRRDERATG